MEVSIDDINVEKLRKDIIDDLWAGVYSGIESFIGLISQIECMDDVSLVNYAIQQGINVADYLYYYKR